MIFIDNEYCMHFMHRSDIYRLVDMTRVLGTEEGVAGGTDGSSGTDAGDKDSRAQSSLMLHIPHVDEYNDKAENVVIHKV